MGQEHAHHWPYVWAAYCVTAAGLGALALVVVFNLRRWAKRAKDLDAGEGA